MSPDPSSSLPSNSSVAISSKSVDSQLSIQLLSKLSAVTASLAASASASLTSTQSQTFLWSGVRGQPMKLLSSRRSSILLFVQSRTRSISPATQHSQSWSSGVFVTVVRGHGTIIIQMFCTSSRASISSMAPFLTSWPQKERKYLILSEYSSLKNFTWINSPRISDDESEEPSHHNITLFSSLSDAICHYI